MTRRSARRRHRRRHRRTRSRRASSSCADDDGTDTPDYCRRRTCCSLLTQATATSPSAHSIGRKLVCQWRLRTVHGQTADEWGILLRNLFSPVGLDIAAVDGIIISSVVPPIDSTLAFMAAALLPHRRPCSSAPQHRHRHGHQVRQPQRGRRRPPGQWCRRLPQIRRPVRHRRLRHHHQLRCHLGNAGEYLGGAIAVGIGISIEALFSKTARLPMVDFREPPKTSSAPTPWPACSRDSTTAPSA